MKRKRWKKDGGGPAAVPVVQGDKISMHEMESEYGIGAKLMQSMGYSGGSLAAGGLSAPLRHDINTGGASSSQIHRPKKPSELIKADVFRQMVAKEIRSRGVAKLSTLESLPIIKDMLGGAKLKPKLKNKH